MAKIPTRKKAKNKLPIPARIWELTYELEQLFGLQNWDRLYGRSSVDEEGKAAEILVNEKYQRVTITLYPAFFRESIRQQAAALVHEFCHYFSDPLNQIAHDLLDGKLHTLAHVQHANELSTSRMAQLIDFLLRDKRPKARKAYAQFIHTPRKR